MSQANDPTVGTLHTYEVWYANEAALWPCVLRDGITQDDIAHLDARYSKIGVIRAHHADMAYHLLQRHDNGAFPFPLERSFSVGDILIDLDHPDQAIVCANVGWTYFPITTKPSPLQTLKDEMSKVVYFMTR